MAPSKARARFFSPHRPSASRSEPSSQPVPILASPSIASLQAPSLSSSATEQAAELLKTTDHIRTQLHEVQRLRKVQAPFLDTDQADWMDRTISDITDAIHDVAVLLEPMRIEQEVRKGKLSLGSQLRWKYRDSQRAIHKSDRLRTCHHSLILVLSHLQGVNASQSTTFRRCELDAGVPPTASLEAGDVNILRAGPVRGDTVASPGGGESGLVGDRPRGERAMGPDVLDGEMDDLLAWRRSRSPFAEAKRPVIYTSEY